MQDNTEPLLQVRHLKQCFGKDNFRAVDDISFDIYPGEVFGLVGESGCGKTTTGRSIIKLYTITDGDIIFKNQRISAGICGYTDALKTAKEKKQKARSAELKEKIRSAQYDNKNCEKEYRARTGDTNSLVTRIQMIFQDPVSSLDPRMTVREIIAEGLRIQGEKNELTITKKVSAVLETVGLLPEYADRYPHEFSGGQRQRIGIARVLIVQPELIIADEPVSALDVSIRAQIINLLNSIRKQMNLTILFIAHDLSVVKYFSDRIAVMYQGKFVELASADELFLHPLHPYTKALLSAIPLPDPAYEKHRVRTIYNPQKDHDYSHEPPTMQEIVPGHSVSCNTPEYTVYKEIRKKL